MAFEWLKKIIPSKNDRELKKFEPDVQRIASYEEAIKKLSDAELQAQTGKFKQQLDNGASMEDILHESFATVREVGWRRMKMRHYDVQMVGGLVLHKGIIAEMKTGEGKTLVATCPMYLNALEGKGAHLVTVNDYLAARDAEWMAQVFNFLGLSVGTIVANMRDSDRKKAYASDITYGTNNEFGFDYLRDNMKFRYEQYVHRYYDPAPGAIDATERAKVLNYAIVDEVDSVLIDEARTPLIISGPADQSSNLYHRINGIIPFLRRDEDFLVDEKAHSVTLTETGVDKVEARLKVANLYDSENIMILHHVNQALKAHYLYKRNVNYLVEGGKVMIVDEFTGRKMEGRRWSDGLHQAVEAKEGVTVQEENQTLATITFQNYFRMYKKLAGMTGTAATEAEEFAKIYGLDCMIIPTNRPIDRTDYEDLIYKNERQKLTAVVVDILENHGKGRPVLVGTASVENSEKISKVLEKREIAHSVLNAKNHGREAGVVAQAGRAGFITIATNMAGRGTDIVLGGNPDLMAADSAEGSGEEYDEKYAEFKAKYDVECAAEKQEVLKAGGLHIIGTERHESRRIDNQLRGRAGRQGDPGSSRFYLSLDDDLLRVFGGERIGKFMEMLKVPDEEPIEHKMVSKAVENAQTKVEGHNFDIRKNLLDYDDVMNMQRRTIYTLRRRVLEGTTTHELILEAVGDVVHAIMDHHMPEGTTSDNWNLEALAAELKFHFNQDFDVESHGEDFDALFKAIEEQSKAEYMARETTILETIRLEHEEDDPEIAAAHAMDQWRFFEREQYLRAIDRLWKAHLVQMDHLRTGVHLNAYAQKDPKLIYKKEGFVLFQEMLERISRETLRRLFHVEVRSEKEIEKLKEERAQQTMEGRGSAPGGSTEKAEKQETVRRTKPKVGRNDPCYCGSGKKYKKCHMEGDEAGVAA